jgi:hypothetical protein
VEGVKRDTYGEDDIKGRIIGLHAQRAEKLGKRFYEEIIVFKKTKKSKINPYAYYQPYFLAVLVLLRSIANPE